MKKRDLAKALRLVICCCSPKVTRVWRQTERESGRERAGYRALYAVIPITSVVGSPRFALAVDHGDHTSGVKPFGGCVKGQAGLMAGGDMIGSSVWENQEEQNCGSNSLDHSCFLIVAKLEPVTR